MAVRRQVESAWQSRSCENLKSNFSIYDIECVMNRYLDVKVYIWIFEGNRDRVGRCMCAVGYYDSLVCVYVCAWLLERAGKTGN